MDVRVWPGRPHTRSYAPFFASFSWNTSGRVRFPADAGRAAIQKQCDCQKQNRVKSETSKHGGKRNQGLCLMQALPSGKLSRDGCGQD